MKNFIAFWFILFSLINSVGGFAANVISTNQIVLEDEFFITRTKDGIRIAHGSSPKIIVLNTHGRAQAFEKALQVDVNRFPIAMVGRQGKYLDLHYNAHLRKTDPYTYIQRSRYQKESFGNDLAIISSDVSFEWPTTSPIILIDKNLNIFYGQISIDLITGSGLMPYKIRSSDYSASH